MALNPGKWKILGIEAKYFRADYPLDVLFNKFIAPYTRYFSGDTRKDLLMYELHNHRENKDKLTFAEVHDIVTGVTEKTLAQFGIRRNNKYRELGLRQYFYDPIKAKGSWEPIDYEIALQALRNNTSPEERETGDSLSFFRAPGYSMNFP